MRKVCGCYLSKSFGQEQGYACAIDEGDCTGNVES